MIQPGVLRQILRDIIAEQQREIAKLEAALTAMVGEREFTPDSVDEFCRGSSVPPGPR